MLNYVDVDDFPSGSEEKSHLITVYPSSLTLAGLVSLCHHSTNGAARTSKPVVDIMK